MLADDKHRSVIRERKKRERNKRIQSILEAAKKVFFSKGYARATMDEIALEAEISKPTIYQYFKTKDDLYFSLMLPVVDELRQHLEKLERKLAEGRYQSGARLLRDLFKSCYYAYESAPDTFRIIQQFQQTGLRRAPPRPERNPGEKRKPQLSYGQADHGTGDETGTFEKGQRL